MSRDPHPNSTAEQDKFSSTAVAAIHQRRLNACSSEGAILLSNKEKPVNATKKKLCIWETLDVVGTSPVRNFVICLHVKSKFCSHLFLNCVFFPRMLYFWHFCSYCSVLVRLCSVLAAFSWLVPIIAACSYIYVLYHLCYIKILIFNI